MVRTEIYEVEKRAVSFILKRFTESERKAICRFNELVGEEVRKDNIIRNKLLVDDINRETNVMSYRFIEAHNLSLYFEEWLSKNKGVLRG